MHVGWEILKGLPSVELTRLSNEQIAKYLET
jgi:vacuolar-type H+-ATPase subunit B/Vma2